MERIGPRRHLDAHLLETVVCVAEDQELTPFGDVADDFGDGGFNALFLDADLRYTEK